MKVVIKFKAKKKTRKKHFKVVFSEILLVISIMFNSVGITTDLFTTESNCQIHTNDDR